MDKDKKWDRKEVVTVDPGSLLSGGVDVHLYGKGKDNYLKSPKSALFFVLSYSFYQGRRDEISSRFEERAKTTLESFLGNNNVLLYSSPRITDKDNLRIKYKGLYDSLKQNKVNKEGDRPIVISLVNFIQFNNEKNILHFLIEQIKSKKIAEAYRNLKRKGVRS